MYLLIALQCPQPSYTAIPLSYLAGGGSRFGNPYPYGYGYDTRAGWRYP